MKKITISIIIFALMTIFLPQTKASFDAVQNNCLFIDGKYFDSCPKYRKQVKMINEVLFDIRSAKEKEVLGKNEMVAEVDSMQKKLKEINAQLFKTGQRNEQKAFFIGYMIEIMDLYMLELEMPGRVEGKVDELFRKTYFNQQQKGIVISDIKLQENAERVLQFDSKIHLQIELRNYMSEVVTQVEDIYCYATVGQKDHIFPLQSPVNLFEANSVKTINISMNTSDHPLLETAGDQTIYCNMVYFTQDKEEQATPYKEFMFVIQEA